MSLKHAILGFLQYAPSTGYELKSIFDTSVRHFWPADQAQIYRTLADLTEDGLASMQVVVQEDRPNRKLYSITEAGRDELHRWLSQPALLSDPRSPALVQVFFAGQLSDEQLLAMFEGAAGEFRQVLERYAAVPQDIAAYTTEKVSPREAFCWLLTLELGRRSMQAHLDWAESVIERIQSGQIPPAENP